MRLGVSAAQLLLLTEFGDRLLGTAAASAGFGMLYAARGLGTAFGPAIARRVLGESDRAIRASITWGFAAAALFDWCFGGQPAPVIALLCISAAHAGGSMVWIGATVLVQRTAPDRVRGRAFALEMALHTLTACVCPLLAAWLVDRGHDPAELVRAFALAIAGMGLCGLWPRGTGAERASEHLWDRELDRVREARGVERDRLSWGCAPATSTRTR
mgnify:CR=1 FL=1